MGDDFRAWGQLLPRFPFIQNSVFSCPYSHSHSQIVTNTKIVTVVMGATIGKGKFWDRQGPGCLNWTFKYPGKQHNWYNLSNTDLLNEALPCCNKEITLKTSNLIYDWPVRTPSLNSQIWPWWLGRKAAMFYFLRCSSDVILQNSYKGVLCFEPCESKYCFEALYNAWL